MNFIALSAETSGTLRDENGVPVEWTLLRIGENPICQEGKERTKQGEKPTPSRGRSSRRPPSGPCGNSG